jgi:hypothetical protein
MMNMQSCGVLRWVIVIFCSGVCGSGALAVTIYNNPITDANPSASNPFNAGDVVDENLTASGVGRGPGINPNAGSNRFNATAWNFPDFNADDYFSWTITPKSDFKVGFASLTGAWQRSGTGPNSYELRTSLDNFTAPVGGVGSISGSGSASNYTIDLSSIQNVTSAIEFRLYAYAGTAAAGTLSINDFTFDGLVEPTGTTPAAFAGDYNDDGVVDSADYVIWRTSQSNGVALPANEVSGIGTTDDADYDDWRSSFGIVEAPGSGTGLSGGASLTVPEPATSMMILTVGGAAAVGLRRRRQVHTDIRNRSHA